MKKIRIHPFPKATTAAEKRAMRVLRAVLTPAQYRRLRRDGYLVLTNAEGEWFLRPRSAWVGKRDQRSGVWVQRGYFLGGYFPWPDRLAAQILAVQSGSQDILGRACMGSTFFWI